MPSFLCPECGSDEPFLAARVQTAFNLDEPWSGVLRRISCERCRYYIPAHLAELWDERSPEHAAEEWRRVYRDEAPRDN